MRHFCALTTARICGKTVPHKTSNKTLNTALPNFSTNHSTTVNIMAFQKRTPKKFHVLWLHGTKFKNTSATTDAPAKYLVPDHA